MARPLVIAASAAWQTPATAMLWDRVDALIDSAPDLRDLRAHGLQLLAARRWRSTGRPVPQSLVREELHAAFQVHAAPRVLRQIRAACSGPILLMKGPVVAARFPDPVLRPFVDLDLVVPDPKATQAELLAAGFVLSGGTIQYPDGLHHVRPLRGAALPLEIELHSRPKWVDFLEPPSFGELLEAAVPDAAGVEGILAPAPPHHALLLAAHLWAHDPLTRLLRILDVALMVDGCDRQTLDSLARDWNLSRLWRSTIGIVDALLLDDARRSWALRTWGRAMSAGREPTVAELHVSRLTAPFVMYPAAIVPRALAAAVRGLLVPQGGESWGSKWQRTRAQVARPVMRRGEHARQIEDAIRDGPD